MPAQYLLLRVKAGLQVDKRSKYEDQQTISWLRSMQKMEQYNRANKDDSLRSVKSR